MANQNSKGNRDLPVEEAEDPLKSDGTYSQGYSSGQSDEARLRNLQQRAEDNGATSLVIGSLLATLVGLGAAGLYLWQRNQLIAPTTIPTPASPAASTPPNPPTKIIERTVEKTAPSEVRIIEVEKPVVREVPQASPAPVSDLQNPSPTEPKSNSTPSDKSKAQPELPTASPAAPTVSPSGTGSNSPQSPSDQLPR